MPGSSRRQGAVRSGASRKGPLVGSGGQRSHGLRGKGPTPKATDRTGHPAKRKANSAAKRAEEGGSDGRGRDSAPTGRGGPGGRSTGRSPGRSPGKRPTRSSDTAPEVVYGRNAVVEALRAGVPASTLYVASRIETDDRVKESMKLAGDGGIALLESQKNEMDRLCDGGVHQGLALAVPAYTYAHPQDLLEAAVDAGQPALIVALDGVTDPRNLGAVVRSAAAFGAHGVVVPQRRAAGVTASAWKVSAGAAARIPVAKAANLTTTLVELKQGGCFVVGLDAGGDTDLRGLDLATGPLVLVVGAEGKGLSRLVRQTCDAVVSIPISASTESLNASVAAGIALYEIAGLRR